MINMNSRHNKRINKIFASLLDIINSCVWVLVAGMIIYWTNNNFTWIWAGWVLTGMGFCKGVGGCMKDSKMYLCDKPKVYWAEVKKTMQERARMVLERWPPLLVVLLVSWWIGKLATQILLLAFWACLEISHGVIGNGIVMECINVLVCMILMTCGVYVVEVNCGIVIVYWLNHFLEWIEKHRK